ASVRPAARAPPAATPQPRRRAWLRIFGVRCSLPCDPPVGGSFMQWRDDTTLPSRGLRPRPVGKSLRLKKRKAQNEQMFSALLPENGCSSLDHLVGAGECRITAHSLRGIEIASASPAAVLNSTSSR